MDIVTALEDIQRRIHGRYSSLPLLSKADREIADCIHRYEPLMLEEKANIKQRLTHYVAWLLLCFSERMANLSLRTKSQDAFEDGLVSLSMIIEIAEMDIRDIMLIFPLYVDVSKRNGYSFDRFLEQEDEFAKQLSAFLNRRDEDKSLQTMGYVIERNEMNEWTYRRTW